MTADLCSQNVPTLSGRIGIFGGEQWSVTDSYRLFPIPTCAWKKYLLARFCQGRLPWWIWEGHEALHQLEATIDKHSRDWCLTLGVSCLTWSNSRCAIVQCGIKLTSNGRKGDDNSPNILRIYGLFWSKILYCADGLLYTHFRKMRCNSEHFAFMFGVILQFEWMRQQESETWRFLKMANSKVILVLPITCSEPFAWFESLACPLSRFLKCNWPSNVSQKCSNWIKLLDFSTSKGKHTSLCSLWPGFLLWQKSQVQRRPLSWVQKRGNWIGH